MFRTRAGVIVVAPGRPEFLPGGAKVQYYNALTGGRAGLLKLANLVPISDAAKALKARVL